MPNNSLNHSSEKTTAALFDIDGTFFRSSLLVEHFKNLMKLDLISKGLYYTEIKGIFEDHDRRQGDYEEYLLKVCEVYAQQLKGIDKEAIFFTAKQVIQTQAARVYRYTRTRIEHHHAVGDKVIFISGSPDYLVSLMAKEYNATDFRASQYLFNSNNEFSGQVVPMWDSESKNKAIDELVHIHNIDLDKSFAYGDTHGDFMMLKRVGNPILINPAKELVQCVAADADFANKAKIIVERKDVVYQIPVVGVDIL